MTGPSATPWRVGRQDPNTGNVPVSAGHEQVAFATCSDWGYEPSPGRAVAKQNAAHLVRCINAHDGLVSALQDAEQEIRHMLDDLCDEPEGDVSANRTLATIAAALGKAGAI
ncbi:MAG: hypothetical protein C0501_26455 [Isosphaera sp.]|nr:hypothetical protein [Isosphaera sp.]